MPGIPPSLKKPQPAFTLAELLIALAILGVIATFTIPKVLQAQQNEAYKATGKEAASMIAQSFAAYQLEKAVTGSTRIDELTPYMNYVKIDTSTQIDNKQTQTDLTCGDSNSECLRLHNGGILFYYPTHSFGGTESTHAIYFFFDPDGKYAGTTDGPGKSVQFFVYPNGRLTTRGSTLPNTYGGGFNFAVPAPQNDPPWFGWD